MPSLLDRVALVGALAIAGVLGVATWVVTERAALAGAVLAGAALALYLALAHRTLRRRAIARRPFPEAWRATLERTVKPYRVLGEPDRRRFEREVAWFLDEQRISGPRGAPVDDELRVLVAASAVVLTFGRPGYRWPRVRDIVVYSDAFDADYRVAREGHVLGMVHAQGPILFSAKALRSGYKDVDDGLNVGLHELAHVLDFDGGAADGVPSLMPWQSIEGYLGMLYEETKRVRKKRSVLRKYAATNEAEFFAVATEAFFERPRALRARHPDLYALLAETFGQDPAADEPDGVSRRASPRP